MASRRRDQEPAGEKVKPEPERRREAAAEEGVELPTAGNPDSPEHADSSGAASQPGPKKAKRKTASEEEEENDVGEAGRESFPASDPPSWTLGKRS